MERLFFVGWFSNADDEGSFYQIDGLEYLAFKKWSQYQKPKYPKPSKLPAPEEAISGDEIEKSFPKE